MVGFGRILAVSQRDVWKEAYLDYSSLKEIVDSIEEKILAVGAVEDSLELLKTRSCSFHSIDSSQLEKGEGNLSDLDLESLKHKFFADLRREIEKMSLFTLQQEGKLADGLGALRFDGLRIFGKNLPDPKRRIDQLDVYTSLCVELVHLLKFICINSVGLRKILKKYNKAFESLDVPYFYVVGGDHLQQLANSRSIMAIQSSLQAVLTESYYQNPVPSNPISDLSFYRFQCAMECSYTLRKNAETLQQPFFDFLSRKAMIMTGKDLNGMDAGSEQAFRWLLRLEPDALMSMNQQHLETLSSRLCKERMAVMITKNEDDHVLAIEDPSLNKIRTWGGVNEASMMLNLLSALLYTVNYYIIAPTANHYAIFLGSDGAFGATLIGASSFSALFAAFVYSFWYTKSTFKSVLVFSTMMPILGNAMYALAISFHSIKMAIFGRILCGFGSAEVVNRQLISACVNFEGMTRASALFVATSAVGMSLGPLLAAFLDIVSGRDADIDLSLPFLPAGGIIYNSVTSPAFVMAGLWLLQLLALVLIFEEPSRINSSNHLSGSDADDCAEFLDSENGATLKSYGSITQDDLSSQGSFYKTLEKGASFYKTLQEGRESVWQNIVVTYRLIFQNPGLSVTILIFGYIEMADEVLISSCSMIVRRYFGWHGSAAGFLIASLGSLVLPAHFVVEKASHYTSERKILFRSLLFILFSLIGILNWTGLSNDLFWGVEVWHSTDNYNATTISNAEVNGQRLGDLLTKKGQEFPYYSDNAGPVIYVLFLSFIFMGTIVLEGVDTSIMAKVTPAQLNGRFVNCGLLATLTGTMGRVCADGMITISALLDIHLFVDFVNMTFSPLAILAILGIFWVARYYEWLV